MEKIKKWEFVFLLRALDILCICGWLCFLTISEVNRIFGEIVFTSCQSLVYRLILALMSSSLQAWDIFSSNVIFATVKSQDIFNLVIMTSLIQSLHLCSSHAYIFAPVMISFPSRVSRVPQRFSGFFQRWIKSTQCKFHIPFI